MRHESLNAALEAAGAQIGSQEEGARVTAYGDAGAEAEVARGGGALRDRSGAARLAVTGKERAEFVNRMCTNDVLSVTPEAGVSAVITTVKGRILDHVLIAAQGERLVLLGSEGLQDELRSWLDKHVVMEDCQVEDLGTSHGRLQVFGADVAGVLQQVVGACPEPRDEQFGVVEGRFQDQPVLVVQSLAPAGTGYELLVPAAVSGALFEGLQGAGLTPVGDQAYETARVQRGLPAMGPELGDHCNPLEAGLRRSVSFTKGCYVGQEVVARLNSYAKVRRHLVGVRFPASAEPGALGDLYQSLLRVGAVTSAATAADGQSVCALAFLKAGYEKPGSQVNAVIEGEEVIGEVVELPFA